MTRVSSSSAMPRRSGRRPATERRPTTIHVSAPENIRDYTLCREPGESDESYAKRKQIIDKLLTKRGS